MWSLSDLLAQDDSEFEALVADLWSAMGYEILRGPVGSADAGIDLLVATRTQPRVTMCIQAKRYQPPNKVGVREIREYASLLHRAEIDVVAVVTTSAFTADAEREAAEHGVKLIDGSTLLGLLANSGLPEPSVLPAQQTATLGEPDSAPGMQPDARETTGMAPTETRRTHPVWGWVLVVACLGGFGAVVSGDAEWWAVFFYIVMGLIGAGLLVIHYDAKRARK